MAKIVNKTKVITGPRTRWSYANVWDPKSINGGTPKYSVSLIIPKSDKKTVEAIKAIIAGLHEFNPMMGHRGCRLTVTYPEIARMQTTAVIRAAINVKKAHPDWDITPEIMIPLVGEVKELKFVKDIVVETADKEIAAGRDRDGSGVLLLRHERPDPNDLRLLPRRRRQVPGCLL